MCWNPSRRLEIWARCVSNSPDRYSGLVITGVITLGNILEILPFEDPVVVLELDGKDAQRCDWSKGIRQPGVALTGEW